MKPTVWVLGAAGRLGGALCRKWRHRYKVRGFSKSECNLLEFEAFRPTFLEAPPAWIVNCAAMTNVDLCEEEKDVAEHVNAWAPGQLAKMCAENQTRMIHISTDYVFDGEKEAPYEESDEPRPVSVYGATKLRGEQAVMEHGSHLVIRVSWVFGPERPSFIDNIVERATKEEKVAAVSDKFSSPSFTDDLCDGMASMIDAGVEGGIYHLCNEGACSWREYGEHAIRCAESHGLEVRTRDVLPLQLTDIAQFVARRPRRSAMMCKRFESTIGRRMRPWREAVDIYFAQKLQSKEA